MNKFKELNNLKTADEILQEFKDYAEENAGLYTLYYSEKKSHQYKTIMCHIDHDNNLMLGGDWCKVVRTSGPNILDFIKWAETNYYRINNHTPTKSELIRAYRYKFHNKKD